VLQGKHNGKTRNGSLPAIVSFRGGELLPLLGARGETAGPVARRDLCRYYELLDEYLGSLTLSEPEARLLCDAADDLLERVEHTASGTLPTRCWLWAAVADAIRDRGLDDKYGVGEPEALVQRIRALEPATARALLDALERYRHARGHDESNARELLTRVGLLRE
jgi:hypothetical protein